MEKAAGAVSFQVGAQDHHGGGGILLQLEKLCEESGVFLTYKPLLKERKQKGLYFRAKCGTPCIVLDTDLRHDIRLGRSVLAEEYGHFKTTAESEVLEIHFSYNRAVIMCKSEELALRWAVNYHMPLEALAQAVRKGYREIHELADYFYVTEWLVWRALHFLKIDIYKSQEIRVKIRDLFSPGLADNLWGLHADSRCRSGLIHLIGAE